MIKDVLLLIGGNPMSYELIGKCLLPQILDKKRMTPTELSDKTGISINQLSAYINNKRAMSLQTARIVATALNCYIDDLYEWYI